MTPENKQNQVTPMIQIVRNIQSQFQDSPKPVVYRFDIFKGLVDDEGIVSKVKSVGSAYVREGMKTYALGLKTFLDDQFFLLKNSKPNQTDADYVILTREPARTPGKKYFWNNVGEGRVMDDCNHGLLKLSWDILGLDLYMNLNPINATSVMEVEKANEAA
jgi:hypothetical protein